MANIFYSFCGEGLGHTSRAISLIEAMPQHNFFVFTYGDGLDFIHLNRPDNLKRLTEIDGLRIVSKNSEVSHFKTALSSIEFLLWSKSLNEEILSDRFHSYGCDLLITDWEPCLPRMAQEFNVPCISIDSQHFFRFSQHKFKGMLKLYAISINLMTRMMIPKVDHYIISSYKRKLIKEEHNATPVDIFVKKSIIDIKNKNEHNEKKHIFIYCTFKEISIKLIETIKSVTDTPIIIYGNTQNNLYNNVYVKAIGGPDFARDLASSSYVFSTAGVQMTGEAAFLGKPCFVVPIPNQYEQYINGECVEELGLGMSCMYKDINSIKVSQFLNVYKDGIAPLSNGLEEAIKIINKYIGADHERQDI